MLTFRYSSQLPASAEEVYNWHARPGALERLTPPWENFELVEQTNGIENGSVSKAYLRIGPARITMVSRHSDNEPGRKFCDTQEQGPFRAWHHTHNFHPLSEQRSELEDNIRYKLPLGLLGKIGGAHYSRQRLEKTFRYRHEVLRRDFELFNTWPSSKPLTFLITGASGVLGQSLAPLLTTAGHTVRRLVRRTPDLSRGEYFWKPSQQKIDRAAFEGVDVVVHLAGHNVAAGRWTPKRRALILDSRVQGTSLLVDTMASLPDPPPTLLSASAIGYYGDRSDEILRESSAPGQGFLAEVCKRWEACTLPAKEAGIRVVNMRIGVVLTLAGGALYEMSRIFRLGAGGPLGHGRQYLSWIAVDDLLRAMYQAALDPSLEGPLNLVSPRAAPQKIFAKSLGRALRRPAIAPAPTFAIRTLLGEMGEEVLLHSLRVSPEKLLAANFAFAYPQLDTALQHLMGLDP